MENKEVSFIKVFDEKRGDIVFEGKVSTDVKADELVFLSSFLDQHLRSLHIRATNWRVTSFERLQDHVELVAAPRGSYNNFYGVLYAGVEDGVLRKSERVPSCECVVMALWVLPDEECEKAFKCEMLEVLEIFHCDLRRIPKEIGCMKRLKKLRLSVSDELKSIPEEIGDLFSLNELIITYCAVENLPKRLKELKMLLSICLVRLSKLQLNTEDLVVFSKLKQLTIKSCSNMFIPSFAQSFWEMIKSTTDLRVLDLDWNDHKQEMVVAALEENGSIVDGGKDSESFVHFFKRNKENHEKALQCVLYVFAIRRWRVALKGVPKEMIQILAMMLWNSRFDVKAWKNSLKEDQ